MEAVLHHRLVRVHQADAARDRGRARGDRILLDGIPFAQDGPAGDAEPRRAGDPGRAGPDPAPVAGPQRRLLPAAAGVAVLFHLHHERDGTDPGLPVPGHVQDRLRLAAGIHRLLPLPVPWRQEPGTLGLPQEHDPAGRAVADLLHPGPGRAAQVLRLPAVHPRSAALREHVRRPPAADDLHDRDVVPAEPVRRTALRRGLLRAGDLRLPARDPGHLAAGLYLHHADRHLHSQLAGGVTLTALYLRPIRRNEPP